MPKALISSLAAAKLAPAADGAGSAAPAAPSLKRKSPEEAAEDLLGKMAERAEDAKKRKAAEKAAENSTSRGEENLRDGPLPIVYTYFEKPPELKQSSVVEIVYRRVKQSVGLT